MSDMVDHPDNSSPGVGPDTFQSWRDLSEQQKTEVLKSALETCHHMIVRGVDGKHRIVTDLIHTLPPLPEGLLSDQFLGEMRNESSQIGPNDWRDPDCAGEIIAVSYLKPLSLRALTDAAETAVTDIHKAVAFIMDKVLEFEKTRKTFYAPRTSKEENIITDACDLIHIIHAYHKVVFSTVNHLIEVYTNTYSAPPQDRTAETPGSLDLPQGNSTYWGYKTAWRLSWFKIHLQMLSTEMRVFDIMCSIEGSMDYLTDLKYAFQCRKPLKQATKAFQEIRQQQASTNQDYRTRMSSELSDTQVRSVAVEAAMSQFTELDWKAMTYGQLAEAVHFHQQSLDESLISHEEVPGKISGAETETTSTLPDA
ncbi:hypothetical protein M231_03674 [Tremella mesenterica]|uniref:Uncharacterized protein n=1 Tax=Tremella mesenterica TaxID=5217 RepID=A0A4Q1BMU2_TREME|nr:uncharacterized protein TREMEDRAFT_63317 [Tremella mesenterica DSM 1558]EIW68850.1 hypothetical protein TREMEDRAFT_63317 [Tremella mesenterica DSM 1558]RXK39050.1 hypothetical protein M231_03674 [Tremella mesenterica]